MSVFLKSLCKPQKCTPKVLCQFCSMTWQKYIVISIKKLHHSTVVLYILHIWCYPMIYHDYLTQDNHYLNAVPSTSSYSNILPIFSSYDCMNFLGYIPPFLFHWMQETMITQKTIIVNKKRSVFIYFSLLWL